jgi:hypothetical protein
MKLLHLHAPNWCVRRAGSGVDKVVFQTEYYQLPAPIFETTSEHTDPFCLLIKTLGNGQERPREGMLLTCLPEVCAARIYDKFFFKRAFWH